MLESEFADILPFLAAGFTGSGSEHYGYDDEISRAESEGGRAPSPWPDILKESGDAAETVLRRYYKVFHLA